MAFDTGSPRDGVMQHISRLGQLARLDFERCAVAGEIIFAVEADAVPISQQDEEARITVFFEKAGKRKLVAKFANLEML